MVRMRPRPVTFAISPAGSAGLQALRRQLAVRGDQAPADILGPIMALRELEAICEGMLGGRGGPNQPNRPSLVSDLGTSLGTLGPQTAAAVGPALASFRSELPRLGKRLDSPQGARVVALSLRPLFDRLSEADVAVAAWRDTVASFTDDDISAEDCELRIRQLVEICEHRGVDWAQRVPTLEALLGDDAGALQRFGELSDQPPATEPQFGGVSEQRRLELCEQVLPELPSVGPAVIWLVVNLAALPDAYMHVGPVRLFDERIWPDGVRAGGTLERRLDGYEPPAELDDWADVEHWFTNLPKGENRVFARVETDGLAVGRARARARDVLTALVDIARPDTRWVILAGEASWRPDGGWSGRTFEDPAELAATRSRPVHVVLDRTGEGLLDFRDDFVQRLVDGDAAAHEAIDDALWTVSVERAPAPQQRIVLATRALERTLSRAREHREDGWAKPAARFLKAPWIDFALEEELFDAGLTAVNAAGDRRVFDEDRAQVIRDAIMPSTSPGRRSFDPRGLAAEGPGVLDDLVAGTMPHRILRDAMSVLTDSRAARERLEHLARRFDRLLARTERQRNAIVHGTGTVEPVLHAVDPFIRVVSKYVAQEAMRQAETGKPPLLELERSRIRALEREARLQAGDDPLDVLFPAPNSSAP